MTYVVGGKFDRFRFLQARKRTLRVTKRPLLVYTPGPRRSSLVSLTAKMNHMQIVALGSMDTTKAFVIVCRASYILKAWYYERNQVLLHWWESTRRKATNSWDWGWYQNQRSCRKPSMATLQAFDNGCGHMEVSTASSQLTYLSQTNPGRFLQEFSKALSLIFCCWKDSGKEKNRVIVARYENNNEHHWSLTLNTHRLLCRSFDITRWFVKEPSRVGDEHTTVKKKHTKNKTPWTVNSIFKRLEVWYTHPA